MSTLGLSALQAGLTSEPSVIRVLASEGGAIQLDVNATFLYMMVVFVVLAFILKPLLFDPVLRVFELREERTEGARAEARAMQEEAGELLERYETAIAEMRRVVTEERDRHRAETARLESALIDQARDTAAVVQREGRAKLETQVVRLREDLQRQSSAVAELVARAALGQGTQP